MKTQITPLVPPRAITFSMRTILAPLAAIVLGTFMAILDTTVVNVAVPTLQRIFTTDLSTVQWVVTGYMLAQAAVIPLTGWLSDRFGPKRLYISALTLFTAGSTLCAVAQTAEMLIAFRVVQALGAGMLLPLALSYIYRLAPPEKRGVVMGTFGIPVLLGPALGPVLSGWLVQYADWRYIFLINVPVGVIAIGLAARALPALATQQSAGRLDLPGAILGPLGFSALIYGISESSSAGWDGRSTVAGLGIGSIALIAFIVRELRAAEPLLDLRVFRSPDFSLATATQWVAQASLFGGLFLLPLFLQQLRGYGPLDTGLYLLPQALAAALFMPIGGRLFDRIGARPLVMIGMSLLAASTWFLSQISATTTGEDLRAVLVLRGAGLGLMMMPLQTQVLNSTPRNLVSRVTSLATALNNVVGSLAIALLATLLQNRATEHMGAARATIASQRHDLMQRAAAAAHRGHATPGTGDTAVPQEAVAALHRIAETMTQNAAALAFDDTFRVFTFVVAAGIVLGIGLRRNSHARAETRDSGTDSDDMAEMLIA